MPFTKSPKFCTRLVCSFAAAAALFHAHTIDPHPAHADHHEAAHVWHVPEPDHSTEPADPYDNSSPGRTAAPPVGYVERTWQTSPLSGILFLPGDRS